MAAGSIIHQEFLQVIIRHVEKRPIPLGGINCGTISAVAWPVELNLAFPKSAIALHGMVRQAKTVGGFNAKDRHEHR
jgi:hypothetical protein